MKLMNLITRKPLTKKLLLSLPKGSYLISNVGAPPIFAEKLPPMNARDHLWKRLQKLGAAGRLCDVAWTEKEFRDTLKDRQTLRDVVDQTRQRN